MISVKKVVFITIGEAPRKDIADSFDAFFKDSAYVSQAGVLNGLTVETAIPLLAPQGEEEVVISTFCDGTSFTMSKQKVEQRLQEKIFELEQEGIEIIVVLCTAEFPHLKTNKALLIEPERVLLPFIKQKFQQQSLGVILPLENQIKAANQKWATHQLSPTFASASPYAFSELDFTKAAISLKEKQVEAIVLDCMGYSRTMRDFVARQSNLPVYQSNELLFEYIKKMYL